MSTLFTGQDNTRQEVSDFDWLKDDPELVERFNQAAEAGSREPRTSILEAMANEARFGNPEVYRASVLEHGAWRGSDEHHIQ